MTMLVVWAAVLLTSGVSAGNTLDPAGLGAAIGTGIGAGAGIVGGGVFRGRIGAAVGGAAGAAVGAGFGAAVAAVVRAVAGNLPLDMAPDSVDDRYYGCNTEMSMEAPDYLEKERNKNSKFKEVWDRIMGNSRRLRRALSTEQLIAIKVYTADRENLYIDFNDAVRSQGPRYKDKSFEFHALHFYLTSTIQALSQSCFTVYRRVDKYFDQDVVNKEIRFGSFTSTSWGQYADADVFGDKSCFEIYTCMGADISWYSTMPHEREVLIPPYEVFRVVGMEKRSEQHPHLPCEVEYKLQSTNTPVSNLNCALFTN